MAKRRDTVVFSLAFLDIMSCGFGAIILVFIVIHYSQETTPQDLSVEMMAIINKLQLEIEVGTREVRQIQIKLEDTEERVTTSQANALAIINTLRDLRTEIDEIVNIDLDKDAAIAALKVELQDLEQETDRLESSVADAGSTGKSLEAVKGQGDRQYLTGIKMGGSHVLILLDASASMLAGDPTNALIRRNLDDVTKRRSDKWQRAVRTVEWVTANMPPDVFFQVFTFNTTAQPLIKGTATDWLSTSDEDDTRTALENLRLVVPGNGTSLYNAFKASRELTPIPDNIFLIVDGLPTMGLAPTKATVIYPADRLRLFNESLGQLPGGVPVNIVLLPMQGDPDATPAYWMLAFNTGGALLAPSKDWP